ncbi:unnamed protein product [Polarella glacialis]|uniref:Uncharacterized protein n=1 Tax=Polarella glacialis TaxID=89957 RepID=A0A813FF56_POLGL|nr:unnamed protein product [Polarella glacialis]
MAPAVANTRKARTASPAPHKEAEESKENDAAQNVSEQPTLEKELEKAPSVQQTAATELAAAPKSSRVAVLRARFAAAAQRVRNQAAAATQNVRNQAAAAAQSPRILAAVDSFTAARIRCLEQVSRYGVAVAVAPLLMTALLAAFLFMVQDVKITWAAAAASPEVPLGIAAGAAFLGLGALGAKKIRNRRSKVPEKKAA